MFGWSEVWYFYGFVFLAGWCWCFDLVVYWLLFGGVMFSCFGDLVFITIFV